MPSEEGPRGGAGGSGRSGARRSGPKSIAIVGPFASGKTTLLEAILERTDAIPRAARTGSGATVGDHSAEAKLHGMSVESTVATTSFMGETITFVDCPGSVEFCGEADAVLPLCDAAIVVAEPDPAKLPALHLVMKKLEDLAIPRMLFLNRIDKVEAGLRDTLKLLQPVSSAPLLLRQIPLKNNGIVIGSIDLALERAYVYREHAESEVREIPGEEKAREIEARFQMLETLADHDDKLMEELLSDVEPPRDQIFDDLSSDLRNGHAVPVFIGNAEMANGVLRLLKAIRHDCPDATDTAARLGLPKSADGVAGVMKTIHTSHGGKLSVVRVLSGALKDGDEVTAADGQTGRISGMNRMLGKEMRSVDKAVAGEVVALGKVEPALTGGWLTTARNPVAAPSLLPEAAPVFAFSLRPRARKDDVRLSAALRKIGEEDPSYRVRHDPESAEIILSGNGEMHLRVAVERLEGRHQIPVEQGRPAIPYRETIRKQATKRGRHRKQSGGHGQFGDVVLDVSPLPRGEGFRFTDTITGGVVPKQYIPSVEAGARDFMRCGPLGFPVVDVAVNLSDGSYHSVDSSDMAFQMAAKLALKEAFAECSPVLLEPVMKVTIATPSDATARITALIPQRRGRILGYDARPGWPGWDNVEALMPMAEIGDMIIELRSATAGAASYESRFDHMAELTGRIADEALARAREANRAA